MHYLISDKTSPLGREIVVQDRQAGGCLFRAHGPVVRLRDELRLDDAQGVEQLWIKEPMLGDRKTVELLRSGQRCATLRMFTVGNLLEGVDVDFVDGCKLHARGDLVGHTYSVHGDTGLVAQVKPHKSHALELDTTAGQDEPVIVGVILAMSAMADAWARAVVQTR